MSAKCALCICIRTPNAKHPSPLVQLACLGCSSSNWAGYLVPDGNPLNLFPAGVLCNEAHAPCRCAALSGTCCHVSTAALAAPVPYPRHIAVLEGHLCWRVKHHPSACQAHSIDSGHIPIIAFGQQHRLC